MTVLGKGRGGEGKGVERSGRDVSVSRARDNKRLKLST
jgi:hypothetical protein